MLLAIAFVMGLAFWIIRKKLMVGGDNADSGGLGLGFTLSDLRQMHAAGQMTDEEFEYAKRKMAARAKAEIDGADPDEADLFEDVEPPIEDLGDITSTAPAADGRENDAAAADDASSAADPDHGPDLDPDNDDGFDDDFPADPDKIDGP
ncbi:MAG: hypothetical protein AAGL98_05105 [Planctomycetota bacterium]